MKQPELNEVKRSAGFSLEDVNIEGFSPMPTPAEIKTTAPLTEAAAANVAKGRTAVKNILDGQDDRLIVITGPCSIHDPKAALEYAERLIELKKKYANDLEIIMRVYFEKPRTSLGWKGLINDPGLDHSFRINQGLRIARELLLNINELGIPAGTEYLDMITPQYIADLISWGAIGARTTESQVHRELASGLSCPVGFKNGTDGNVKIAIDAVKAAEHEHVFLSVTKGGHSAIVVTGGNEDAHVILRGGKAPNYGEASVDECCKKLEEAGMPAAVMIDASHSNSEKKYKKQLDVIENICGQLEKGSRKIMGVMIESNLVEGNQPLEGNPNLTYGNRLLTDVLVGKILSRQLTNLLRQ